MQATAVPAKTVTSDVLVVGGGVIGAATAWRCAQRGLSVTLIDPDPDRGAWHTAAGMLAPVTELHFTETPLLRLNLDSLRRWAAFAAELSDEAQTSAGLRECGTVLVAWDAADLTGLRELHEFSQLLGVDASMVTGRELRELEPAVAPGLPGGLFAPGDHQVDPRLLHSALFAALRRRGVRILASEATVTTSRNGATGDRVTGAQLRSGTTVTAGHVVLAAGCWSASVPGLPAHAVPPVRPVKGQTLRLRLPGLPRLRHVLRGSVQGNPVYLVPRADGRIVVGASSEEAGFDRSPRAGAVYELLRDAQSLLPELSEAVLDEVSTGLRPGSPDNAPLVGPSGVNGLIHATGHFRNGILLTPVTADGVADLIVDGTLPEVLEPFTPQRFAGVPA